MKDNDKYCTLELPLKVEPWQADKLNKIMKVMGNIYNQLLAKKLKELDKLRATHEWNIIWKELVIINEACDEIKEIQKHHESKDNEQINNSLSDFDEDIITKEYEECINNITKKREAVILKIKSQLGIEINEDIVHRCKDSNVDDRIARILEARKKAVYGEINKIYRTINLNNLKGPRYSLYKDLTEIVKRYPTLGIDLCSYTILPPLSKAFEKYLYGNGNKIKFRRVNNTNTISTKIGSQIKFIEEDGQYYVLYTDIKGNLGVKPKDTIYGGLGKHRDNNPIKLKVLPIKTEYEQKMLCYPIKKISIVRKLQKTKYHYYVQLCLQGCPYNKKDYDGILSHTYGKGQVGIQIWRNRLCAISNDKVKCFDLTPNQVDFDNKRADYNRLLDELKRELCPDNYSEDGKIKKGVIIDGKKQKLDWSACNDNKEFIILKRKLRELYRKNTVNNDLLQNKIIYELLEMGNDFLICKSDWTTKKQNNLEELSQQEKEKKKDRRREIQNVAPSRLITKLVTKLSYKESGSLKEINIDYESFWYNRQTRTCDKTVFFDDYVKLDEKNIVPHTLYRAFMLKYYNENDKCFMDVPEEAWNRFLNLAGDNVYIPTNKNK